jgi:hypothetical protein
MNGDIPTAIEYEFSPEQESQQGFEIVGSLSSMFSTFYRHATAKDGNGVAQIHAKSEPGALGQLIPGDYKGNALPLWRLIVHPKAS